MFLNYKKNNFDFFLIEYFSKLTFSFAEKRIQGFNLSYFLECEAFYRVTKNVYKSK